MDQEFISGTIRPGHIGGPSRCELSRTDENRRDLSHRSGHMPGTSALVEKARTRPGLQADSPSRSRIPATSRWHIDRHVQVPIPRLRSSSRHRRTRVVHDRRERGMPSDGHPQGASGQAWYYIDLLSDRTLPGATKQTMTLANPYVRLNSLDE